MISFTVNTNLPAAQVETRNLRSRKFEMFDC